MKARLMLTLALLTGTVAHAEPGAAPVTLCNFTTPHYSEREIADIENYRRCLRGGEGTEREPAREKAYRLSLQPAFQRQVQCGEASEWMSCTLNNEAEECSRPSTRRELPGRFSCEELARRYPEIRALIAAYEELHRASERDLTTRARTKAQCSEEHRAGYELVHEECRNPTVVVPP